MIRCIIRKNQGLIGEYIMMILPLIDQKKQYQRLENDILNGIQRVLEHGQYILGPEVYQLEEALKAYTHTQDVITVSNGTDALTLAMMAYNIQPHQVVFVPEFTYCATAGAVARLGAIPYFVDVDPRTYLMCPQSLEAAIVKAKAEGHALAGVISVDLFGQAMNPKALEPLLHRYHLWWISDAAQAFGAEYEGQTVGQLAPITTISFYPSKPLGGYGDGGGVIVRDDANLAQLIRTLRVHGHGRHRYEYDHIGMNARLDSIQAAILLAKLSVFNDEKAARSKLADFYDAHLDPAYTRPSIAPSARSVYAQYTLLLPEKCDRTQWMEYLSQHGVASGIYYPSPLSTQRAYAHFPTMLHPDSALHGICRRIVALPMHGYLTDTEAEHVVHITSQALRLSL